MYPASTRWFAQWYPSVHWGNQWYSSGIPVYTGPASVHWLRVRDMFCFMVSIIHWELIYICQNVFVMHSVSFYICFNTTPNARLVLCGGVHAPEHAHMVLTYLSFGFEFYDMVCFQWLEAWAGTFLFGWKRYPASMLNICIRTQSILCHVEYYRVNVITGRMTMLMCPPSLISWFRAGPWLRNNPWMPLHNSHKGFHIISCTIVYRKYWWITTI